MASAQDYASWIVKNADKKGTPEFDTVVKAYQAAKSGAAPAAAATAPAMPSDEGMPAPRQGPLDTAWSAVTGGRNLNADLQFAKEATAPPSLSDIGGAISNEAQSAAQFAKEGGESAVENFKAGRPASAVLGAGQQLLGGAGVLFSPVTGTVNAIVNRAVTPWMGKDVGERASTVANALVAPEAGAMLTRPLEMAANVGGRVVNAGENVFNPKLNALIQASGEKAPEIINALRSSTSGVETAGQAAAPARSAGFSQLTQAVAEHAPDVVDEAKLLQNKVLEARANIAEGKSTEAAQSLADAVAEPNVQETGQKLIDIAEKEKKLSQTDVIGPKFKAAEELGKGANIEIPNVLKKANELVDTIDPDAAAVLSRKLSKFQGETTTPELMGPGGATYKGKPVTTAPTATLEDIGDIRSAINDAAAKAKAAGQDSDYRRLMALHDEVTNSVKNSTTLSQEAKDAYFDAVKTYADEHAPRFKTGLQVNLFKIRNGENAITPSNVVNRFFNNADTTDNFVALFGENPSAMSEAQKGMEGLYRDKVIKDGAIDTAAHDAFMKKYGAQIDKLDATGLNIRDKLDTLANETARATAPETNIAEVRGAVKGGPAAQGPVNTAVENKARAIVDATSPEDLTSLRDAVEIARRQADYKTLATMPNANQVGVPIVPSKAPSFLDTKLRIVTEAFRRVAGKLDTKLAKELGAMLHDPTRLDEAANLLDQAMAMRQRQQGRVFKGDLSTPYASVIGARNALAPQPNQNALAQ